MNDKDFTPTYLAWCPECGGLIAASVADPMGATASLRASLKDRNAWRKRGERVVVGTVQDVRESGRMGHEADCARGTP